MDKKQQAFALYVAEKFGAKTSEEIEQVFQNLTEQDLESLVGEFEQLWAEQENAQAQQIQAARRGAKIKRLRKLNDICPEGYEMQLYELGGKICKKCVKKAQEAEKAMQKELSAREEFLATRKQPSKILSNKSGGILNGLDFTNVDLSVLQCGGKMKKKTKAKAKKKAKKK